MGSRKSWGKGQYHEGKQRGSSLRFLPLIPLGISKPKPATYLETERKKKKKSTYGVIDNYKKNEKKTQINKKTKTNKSHIHTEKK